MIAKICPRSYRRYTSLPILGPILNEFTTWFHERGYSASSIERSIHDTVLIDHFLHRYGVQRLGDITHEALDRACEYYKQRRPHIHCTVGQFKGFLQETGRLALPPSPPMTPARTELNRYVDYLQDVRGLAATTIQRHLIYSEEFLEYMTYDTNPKSLRQLSSKEIEGFICICAKRQTRYSLRNVVGYLRSFLRFEYNQGALHSPLHKEIDMPRIYRLEKLPRSLPREVVESFLHSIDRTEPHGIRDYTMFFLIATYGMRACEIALLTLDDIDWRSMIIRVTTRKANVPLFLPLTDASGDVLVEYLRKVRPRSPYRQLFLRERAPNGPIKSSTVTAAFERWARRSGLEIPYCGPHCLRHSYAVHLLLQGTSFKTIGDLLGHRNTESTSAYLRLAVEDLRSVALPVPQDYSITTPLKIVILKRKLNAKDAKSFKNQSAKVSTPLKSFLRKDIQNYLELKGSLGLKYRNEIAILHSLDTFLANRYPTSEKLTTEIFNRWCVTFSHVSPTVRRRRMVIVRNFCLYRNRSHPHSFVPDSLTFPANHQARAPYIFSEADIARLLSATKYLHPCERFPLQTETFRLAIILLYTMGLRRGELLRLKLDDYDQAEKTLLIQKTKFHKYRIVPLSPSVAIEIGSFLNLRLKNHQPMDVTSTILWHQYKCNNGEGYAATLFGNLWASVCTALRIFTESGSPPRTHNLRRSFAVNALQRWYQAGENVQAKLPLLSAFMGHGSVDSTAYYLPFVKGLRSEASTRFERCFGNAITIADPDSIKDI